jgi:hypothetical protein
MGKLQVVEDPDKWVAYWVRLAEDIARNDAAKPWVLFDLLNEPDCQQIGCAAATKPLEKLLPILY